MKTKPRQKIYRITLQYTSGMTRTVMSKGTDREVAERRALKHNPAAIGVKRDAV